MNSIDEAINAMDTMGNDVGSLPVTTRKLLKAELEEAMRMKFMYYKPYPPQLRFHNSKALERILSGANQSGKTFAGAIEAAFHITGYYPEWFEGRRLKPRMNPITGRDELAIWVVGTDNKTTRDNLQKKIVGDIQNDFKGGVVHRQLIKTETAVRNRGTPDMLDSIKVEHSSGCDCTVYFRSYEQGRENLQSATIDIVYCDEEPPADVLGELRARLTATGGLMYMAFTPLKGMTPLVQEFWDADDPDKFLVCMSIFEAGHMDKEKLDAVKKRYQSLNQSEREARMKGVPTAGTGLVFPYNDEDIMGVPPEKIPYDWLYLNAFDFGRGEHPNALLFSVINPHTNTIYIYDGLKTTHKSVAELASVAKKRSKYLWVPYAYPHDLMKDSGTTAPVGKEDKTSEGYTYKKMYEDEGLIMTPEFAKTADGSMRVEVGLTFVRQMIEEGRLKVAPHLLEWFKERQTYRYGDDLKPVKENDHFMDCTRYLCIMTRHAISLIDGGEGGSADNSDVKDSTDIFS